MDQRTPEKQPLEDEELMEAAGGERLPVELEENDEPNLGLPNSGKLPGR